MKLLNTLHRHPLAVNFGRGGGGGGSISIVRDADSAVWITDAGANAELLAADTANAGVMTASDRQELSDLAQGRMGSLAELAAANVAASVQTVRLDGYNAPGDGGGGLWRRVPAEPPHLMKVQTADGAWFEIAPEGRALNVRAAGAVGDGIADDRAAIERAASFTAQLVFPAGIYRVTGELAPPIHPIHWRGAGADTTRGGIANPAAATILADHGNAAILRIAPANLAESERMRIEGIEFRSTSTLADRHGILLDGRSHWTELKDLVFSDLTGYAIAFDPTRAPYCQNMALRDLSFFNCGGAMGYTAEPLANANYLAMTLLEISNVNIDHAVNPVSPQRYLWDWRAIRQVNATTFLAEGAPGGAPTTQALIGIGSDSGVTLRSVWMEFTASAPQYLVHHVEDPSNQFFGAAESHLLIENYVGPGGIAFDAATEADAMVRGWTYYTAASVSDLASFAGTGGSLRVEGLSVKAPFSVPGDLRGRCEIVGVKSADIAMPFLNRGPALLARWRATETSPVAGFDSAHLSISRIPPTIATEAVETDGRARVYRATSVAGSTPDIRFGLFLDPAWVGAYLTAACRFKFTADPADLGVNFRALYTDSTLGAESGSQVLIDAGGVGAGDGAWRTGVVTFRSTSATPLILSRHLGTAPSLPVELRIAAFDLYLGTDWREPLDIPG